MKSTLPETRALEPTAGRLVGDENSSLQGGNRDGKLSLPGIETLVVGKNVTDGCLARLAGRCPRVAMGTVENDNDLLVVRRPPEGEERRALALIYEFRSPARKNLTVFLPDGDEMLVEATHQRGNTL